MPSLPLTVFVEDTELANPMENHPIIDREEVMWAARKFILVYGSEAPTAIHQEVSKLDKAGKLHVAEMFEYVRVECERLLSKSERFRARPVH